MLFNSFEFATFFILVCGTYYAATRWSYRKVLIVLASYIFYGAWNPPYLFLLIGTTALDYVIAQKLPTTEKRIARKFLVSLTVIMNIGVLAFFKYSEWLVANLNALLRLGGLPDFSLYTAGLIVPIGLSFYTFQSIAYVVDVYRGEVKPVRSLLDYAAFVSFFPLLAAGPIMRAAELVPQLNVPRPTPNLPAIGTGLYLIVLGLSQKIVMADNIAPLVDTVFKTPAAFSTLDLWAAVYGFAFQIYFDFAGYSNIAMGLAALLGFTLPRNFAMPYIAIGFSDFWRRWHISLSRWLRDYLYIPLGGNRCSSLTILRNLIITMLLGGLWHGASWTFVLWGALHGSYLVAERGARAVARLAPPWLMNPPCALSALLRLAALILTFHFISFAWVFFRARDGLDQSKIVLEKMARFDGAPFSGAIAAQLPMVALALLLLAAAWTASAARLPLAPSPLVRAALVGLMLGALVLIPGNRSAFIYFQF